MTINERVDGYIGIDTGRCRFKKSSFFNSYIKMQSCLYAEHKKQILKKMVRVMIQRREAIYEISSPYRKEIMKSSEHVD